MLHALVVFASEAAGEGSSHVPFYVAGLLLVGFAVIVSALGIMRPDRFAEGSAIRSAVVGVAALLVVGVCATAVITG
jgi:hypothetical protein